MKEYHYPDFMPEKGEAVLVRDFLEEDWHMERFYKFDKEKPLYPWRTRKPPDDDHIGWKYCAPRG